MFRDVTDYSKTCDLCLRSKRNFNFRSSPLNPLEIPRRPGQIWQIDFKTLPRQTKYGNIAILCCIDAFTGWPVLRAVPDLSAFTAAKIFFNCVITSFGTPERLISDRGSLFTAKFFDYLMKMFGIQHRMSASRAPRTNGLAENLIGKVSQMLKRLCKDDSEVEDKLPIIEFSLRATAHTRTGYTPFELCFGTHMRVGEVMDANTNIPFTGDYKEYVGLLRSELTRLHEQVRQDKLEVKERDKEQYDKAHKVVEPTWKIGQSVLLEDKKI